MKSENILWVVLAAILAFLFFKSKSPAVGGAAASNLNPVIAGVQNASGQIAPTINAITNAGTAATGFLSKLFGGGGSSVPAGTPASVQADQAANDAAAFSEAQSSQLSYPSIVDVQNDPNVG